MATLCSMADIPSSIPQEIRAGDTAKWRRELSDYPADDGWVLAYTAVSATAAHAFTAAADGTAHLVTVAASETTAWAAGNYRLTEFATKASERYTLGSTSLRVLPDLAAANTGIDARTHARKVLDAIEAWLEAKAPTAGAMEIAGRKVQNYPLTDLLALRDRYRAEVAREEATASGRPGGRILTRFC